MTRVNLGPMGYDIAVVTGKPGFGLFAASRLAGRTALVVGDSNIPTIVERVVAELRAARFDSQVALVPHGEASKSLAVAASLYERLAHIPADRNSAVIAVGGGVVGDLAGFVAATYARGLPWLVAPTTLLAMVDSSVGGKVGVNLPQGKNLVGAFHQPAGVWVDTAVLASLPDREYHGGLAEVVKYGAALDAVFFEWLEANADAVLARDPAAVRAVVSRCCELKARIVERDEREVTGERMVLNYGHTFAHAFEVVAGYQDLSHGEAVAMGMGCAASLAERLGLIPAAVRGRQTRLLRRFALPVTPPAGSTDDWLAAMRRDKKATAGRLRFVLPTRVGAASVVEVDESHVRATLTPAPELS